MAVTTPYDSYYNNEKSINLKRQFTYEDTATVESMLRSSQCVTPPRETRKEAPTLQRKKKANFKRSSASVKKPEVYCAVCESNTNVIRAYLRYPLCTKHFNEGYIEANFGKCDICGEKAKNAVDDIISITLCGKCESESHFI